MEGHAGQIFVLFIMWLWKKAGMAFLHYIQLSTRHRQLEQGENGAMDVKEAPVNLNAQKFQQKLQSPKAAKDLKAAVQTVSNLQLLQAATVHVQQSAEVQAVSQLQQPPSTRQTRAWALRRSLLFLKSSAVVH